MLYYLVYGTIYLLSLLPLWALYLLSDFVYIVLYKILGYRKAVVKDNLKNAFPLKSNVELLEIEKKFYRNLCDMMVETIKLLSITSKTLDKHFIFDRTVIDKLRAENRSVQVHLGHYFNWEWGSLQTKWHTQFDNFLVVFMPLKNKTFDKLFLKFREKFGAHFIAANDMSNQIKPFIGKNYLIGLIADQNPSNPQKCYWSNFMGRKAPFHLGPENAARLHNIPVVFINAQKIKRGLYKCSMELAFENPSQTQPNEITEAFVRHMEKVITNQPEIWVWSHKRWKHKEINPLN